MMRTVSAAGRMRLFVILGVCLLGMMGRPVWAADPIEITVTVPIAFPPYYILDDQGRPDGFAIDVMNAVAKRAGYKVQYVPEESWNEVLKAFKQGESLLIPNAGMTAERARYADFTPPVETFPISIFVRRGTNIIFDSDQLRGKKVAVVVNNVGATLLKDRTDLTAVVFNDTEHALFSLLAGEVDALVYPEPVTWRLARKAEIDHRIKVVGAPLAEVKRAIAVRKGMPDLHRRLSLAVSEFVNTPEYGAIYAKWFGPPQKFWTDERTLHLMIVQGSALAAFIFLTVYLWFLNRKLKAARVAAENASTEKSRFLAAASHDIRQPVQALHLFLAALRSKTLDPDAGKVVGQIHETLDDLSGLLDRLSDVARLDAGLIAPQRRAVDLAGILDGVVQEVTPAADMAGTRVRCMPCTARVFTDPDLLEKMLRNVLDNALKYSQGGKVMVGCRRRNAHVFIEVWDNGCGIPADSLDDIFEDFMQVGNEGRNRAQGLGIGLAVVKRLSVLLGHPVHVQSWVGKGSMFSIEAPLVDEGSQ